MVNIFTLIESLKWNPEYSHLLIQSLYYMPFPVIVADTSIRSLDRLALLIIFSALYFFAMSC